MAEPVRLWVVDDDRSIRFVLSTALTEAGYAVSTFASADEALLARTCLGRFLKPGEKIYRSVGCPACGRTGYRGRTGIHELFLLDEAMRRAILQGQDANSLHQLAMQAGMHSLHEDGLRKVAAGVTALDEVARVTQDQQEQVDA